MSFGTARRLLVVLLAALIAIVLVAPLLAVTGARAAQGGAQRGTTTAPAHAARGSKVTITGRFSPARRGRPVVLETYDAGARAWRRLARATQDAAGVARFTTTFRRGPVRYRTRALPVRAARGYAAPAARVAELTNLTRGDAVSASPSVSRDGRHMAFYSAAPSLGITEPYDGGVLVMDTATRAAVRIDPGGSNGAVVQPSISPNGRFVSFAYVPERPTPDRQAGIYLWDRRTGQRTMVTPPPGTVPDRGEPQWRPSVSDDGYVVYVEVAGPDGEEDYRTYGWDHTTGETERIPFSSRYSDLIGVTADGRYVFGGNADSSTVRWDRETGKVTPVLPPTTGIGRRDVSANGRFLAYTVRSADTGTLDLRVKNLATGAVRRVPRGTDVVGQPSVSDDGDELGFVRTRDGSTSGGGIPVALVWHRTTGRFDRLVARDGQDLAVVLAGDGRSAVVTTDAELLGGPDNWWSDIYRWRP